MKNKRISRFFKRYLMGLLGFYAVLTVVAYVRLITANDLEYTKEIPQYNLENHLGEFKSFKDYKGKVLLVDFWFQGCQPCLEEMKYFPELLKKYHNDLAIMSISIDSKAATKKLLEQKPKPWGFLQSQNKNWTFYNDNRLINSYVTELNVTQYPTYLLFNKEGEFVNTPFSGIAGVENQLNGIFGFSLTYDVQKENITKLATLIIPYSILVLIVLLLQFLMFQAKKMLQKVKD